MCAKARAQFALGRLCERDVPLLRHGSQRACCHRIRGYCFHRWLILRLQGQSAPTDRGTSCVAAVDASLGNILGQVRAWCGLLGRASVKWVCRHTLMPRSDQPASRYALASYLLPSVCMCTLGVTRRPLLRCLHPTPRAAVGEPDDHRTSERVRIRAEAPDVDGPPGAQRCSAPGGARVSAGVFAQTRQKALEKLSLITRRVGYPQNPSFYPGYACGCVCAGRAARNFRAHAATRSRRASTWCPRSPRPPTTLTCVEKAWPLLISATNGLAQVTASSVGLPPDPNLWQMTADTGPSSVRRVRMYGAWVCVHGCEVVRVARL